MHTHTIEYQDYDNNPKKKVVHFNLTEAELTKIQLEFYKQGGVQVVMNQAIESDDPQTLVDFIDMMIHRAYGVKSADGEDFDKSPELMRKFENSAYYSPLFMMLFQDGGKAGAAFLSAIMPAELIAKAEANVRSQGEAQAKLDAQRAAGENVLPDARSIFDQAQEARAAQTPLAGQLINAQAEQAPAPTIARPDFQAPIVPSQQYQPQNQPSFPQISEPAPVPTDLIPPSNDPGYQVVNETTPVPTETPAAPTLSYEQAIEQGLIQRPPHESGPGFEAQK